MGFGTLAIIAAAGLIGPLLALRSGWNIPVVLGELVAGLVLGATGFGWLDAADPTFTFLADIGFALVMFVAGSHVPVRDPVLRRGIRPALLRAIAVGVIAAVLGVALSTVFDTGHAALYAVLMASSSAALILPIVDSLRLTGPAVLELLPQVAIADAACIVALPLVIDPAHAGRAALGAAGGDRLRGADVLPAAIVRELRPAPPGAPDLRSSANSPSNCGSAWRFCSRWPRSRSARTCRSCWRASPSASSSRPSASRAGWPGSSSRSPRASSARCSSSGSARRSTSANWRRNRH